MTLSHQGLFEDPVMDEPPTLEGSGINEYYDEEDDHGEQETALPTE